jgi:hypothetical protein
VGLYNQTVPKTHMHLWPRRLAFYYLLLLSPTSVSALQIAARPLPEDSGKPERNTSLLLLAALSCPNISICSSETKAQQTIRGDAGTETACLVEVPGKKASVATATYSSTGRVAVSILATSLLRFQCCYQKEAFPEIKLHSLQSCKSNRFPPFSSAAAKTKSTSASEKDGAPTQFRKRIDEKRRSLDHPP